MPEAFPVIQAGIPKRNFKEGRAGVAKDSEAVPDPHLFSSLMQQYGNPDSPKEEAAYPDLEKVHAALRGGMPLCSPSVLDLMVSLKDELQRDAPHVLAFAEDLAGDALDALSSDDAALRLRALLSRLMDRCGNPGVLLGEEAESTAKGLLRLAGNADSGDLGKDLLRSFSRERLPMISALPESEASAPDEKREESGNVGTEARSPVLTEGGLISLAPAAVFPDAGFGVDDDVVASGNPSPLLDTDGSVSGEGDSVPVRNDPAELARLRAADAREGREAGVPDGDDSNKAVLRSFSQERHMGRDQDSERDGREDALRRRARIERGGGARDTEELPNAANRTHRHPDFQSFFEDVLAARRPSQPSAAPLQLDRGSLPSAGDFLREGLDNVVRFARVSGEQRASLIVDPPALGRLTVELASGTAGLEANIKVSSEQVRQLVQDQITQLRMSLAQQGVQLAQFTVDVQQDDGRRQQGFDRSGRRRSRRVAASDDVADTAPTDLFRVDLTQGLLYWVG